MIGKKNIKPSENELAILQVLWDQGLSTAKEINEVLSRQKPTIYTHSLADVILFVKVLT